MRNLYNCNFITNTQSGPEGRPNSTLWLYNYFRYIQFHGRIGFTFPFVLLRSSDGNYTMKGGTPRKVIFIVVQLFLLSHITYRWLQDEGKSDDIIVMKLVFSSTFILLILYDALIFYWCGWRSNDTWLKIFQQGDEIQWKFEELFINIQSNWDYIAGIAFSIVSFGLGLTHIISLRNIPKYDGAKLNTDDDIKFIPFTKMNLEALEIRCDWCNQLLSVLFATPDIFVYGIWHFGDGLRLTAAYAVRKLYIRLNDYLHSVGREEIQQNFGKIIGIHQNITTLVSDLNQLLGPITFVSMAFEGSYACYYSNFILFGFGGTLRRICFANFAIRTAFTLWITADVHTQAHSITSILSKLSSHSEKFPDVDPNKFKIFMAQVYVDHIGFKGLNFFTVSKTFLAKVLSALITYTIIILQFSKM